MDTEPLAFPALTTTLKAAGEATRLRILALIAEAELTVSDLTEILRQSQPRLSRHLRLLAEAGLVERFREGHGRFFGSANAAARPISRTRLIARLDPGDPVIARDRERLAAVRSARAAAAQNYFRRHAAEWDRIRELHVADDRRGRTGSRRARRQADPLTARSRHRHRADARTVRAADRTRHWA